LAFSTELQGHGGLISRKKLKYYGTKQLSRRR